jgi:glutamine synthetase
LLFCGAVIRGVNLFGPLLRAVIATAGNDHRLGANEAPPAIFSVYLGAQLEGIYDSIKEGNLDDASEVSIMDLGLSQIPTFVKDSGDRNRTSPFAFTGNRFEFRAVGSEQSVAGPLITMNTMLADSLNWIAAKLETELASGSDKTAAVVAVLKDLMADHGQAIFGGDGYSAEWHKEAVEERGLANLPTTADALPALKSDIVKELFASTGVLTAEELASRFEVYAEVYILKIETEAKIMIDMAKTMIYPAATRYMSDLAATAAGMRELGVDFDSTTLNAVADLTNDMTTAVSQLGDLLAEDDHGSEEDHMQFCATKLLSTMDAIRTAADALEVEIADDLWPLPSYHEMLNIK